MKGKCSEGLLMRVRRRRVLSRDSTTLIVYYRMIAPRHTTECDLVDFASPLYMLYRRRPTLETPLFRIDPFNLTGPVSSPRAGLNCARGKAFSSFAVFREIFLLALPRSFRKQDRLISSRHHSRRVFEATN